MLARERACGTEGGVHAASSGSGSGGLPTAPAQAGVAVRRARAADREARQDQRVFGRLAGRGLLGGQHPGAQAGQARLRFHRRRQRIPRQHALRMADLLAAVASQVSSRALCFHAMLRSGSPAIGPQLVGGLIGAWAGDARVVRLAGSGAKAAGSGGAAASGSG
ncbi:hypothetical protein KN198_17835 (plasmid) [Ralstonia solanacearum]|nr:hypothetical protein KN198_17835 [Ralstonia solanacearum]